MRSICKNIRHVFAVVTVFMIFYSVGALAQTEAGAAAECEGCHEAQQIKVDTYPDFEELVHKVSNDCREVEKECSVYPIAAHRYKCQMARGCDSCKVVQRYCSRRHSGEASQKRCVERHGC